jgi:hypothetical protein
MEKRRMKTRILIACVALGLAAFGGSKAFAGQRTPEPIFISTTGMFAYGSLGSVRNAGDTRADIGCTVYYASSAYIIGCSAIDTTGVSRSCFVPAGSRTFFAVRSLTEDSLLYFRWDSAGNCTEIHVSNSSEFEPKRP